MGRGRGGAEDPLDHALGAGGGESLGIQGGRYHTMVLSFYNRTQSRNRGKPSKAILQISRIIQPNSENDHKCHLQEFTVTDDTVLEEHLENPDIVQMRILGEGGNFNPIFIHTLSDLKFIQSSSQF